MIETILAVVLIIGGLLFATRHFYILVKTLEEMGREYQRSFDELTRAGRRAVDWWIKPPPKRHKPSVYLRPTAGTTGEFSRIVTRRQHWATIRHKLTEEYVAGRMSVESYEESIEKALREEEEELENTRRRDVRM